MSEEKRKSFVRVHPSTRHKLKVLAALRNMTMQDMIAWLVTQELERERKKAGQ